MSPSYPEPVLAEPEFELVKVNNPIGSVVASQETILELHAVNQTGQLQIIRYSISPIEEIDPIKVTFNETTGDFLIAADAFKQNVTYSIELTLQDQIVASYGKVYTLNATKQFNFTTVAAPSGGSFTVSPHEGYENQTVFDLVVKDYKDYNYPLTVDFPQLNISEEVYFEDSVLTKTVKLPLLTEVVAVITNSLGELTVVSVPVNVTIAPLNWTEQIDMAFQRDSIATTLFELQQVVADYCLMVDQQVNQTHPFNLTQGDASEYNHRVLAHIRSYFNQPVDSSIGQQLRRNVAVIELVELLRVISDCEDVLDLPTVTKIIDIMDQIDTLGYEYQIYQQDDLRLNKLLKLVDDQLVFINTEMISEELISDGRSLVLKLREFVNKLADNRCQSIDEPLESSQTMFDLHLRREDTNSTRTKAYFVQTNDRGYISIPQSEMIDQTLEVNPNASFLCYQVIFYDLNSVLFTDESDDFSFVEDANLLIQVETIDSEGYKLLGRNPVSWSNETQHGVTNLSYLYNLNFEYDFPAEANEDNFDARNVSCSAFNGESWDQHSCQTFFFFRDNMIKCQCDSITDSFYQLTKTVHKVPEVQKPVISIKKSDQHPEWITTVENTLLIQIEDGSFEDPSISLSIDIQPTEEFDGTEILLNQNASLTFSENYFSPGMNYTVTVTVTNSTSDQFGSTIKSSQSISFLIMTEQPPLAGSFQVNPEVGYENTTQVFLQVAGWQSDHLPLGVQLYGVHQGSEFEIALPNPVIVDASEVWQYSGLMQTLQYFKIVLTDKIGLQSEAFVDCHIKPVPLTWQQKIDLAFETEDAVSRFVQVQTVVLDYNALSRGEGQEQEDSDEYSGITPDEAFDLNIQVLNRTQEAFLFEINNKESLTAVIDLILMMNGLEDAKEPAIFDEIMNTLILVSIDEDLLSEVTNGSETVDKLYLIVDNLLVFIEEDAALQDQLGAVLDFKKELTNSHCSTLKTEYQSLQSKYEVSLFKTPLRSETHLKDLTFTHLRDFTEIQIPQSEMIEEERIRNPDAEWICFQVTFYSVDRRLLLTPGQGFSDVNYSQTHITVIESIDSSGFELLSDTESVNTRSGRKEDGVNLIDSYLLQSFKYEFPAEATSQNFNQRNASCSYFDLTSESWSYEGCKTFYYISQNRIHCRCDSVKAAYYTLMVPTFEDPQVSKPAFTVSQLDDSPVVTSQSTEFLIDLESGSLSDDSISYEIQVEPHSFVNTTGIKVDEVSGVVTLQAYTLQQKSIIYTMNLTVTNSSANLFDDVFTNSTTVFFQFRTTGPPANGSFSISPQNGVEYETEFTVRLSGWQSENYPLTVNLNAEFYSFLTDDEEDQDSVHHIPVNQKEIFSPEDVWTLKTELPALHLLKLTLTDKFGEVTNLSKNLRVEKRPPVDLGWQEQIDRAFEQPTVVDKYMDLLYVVKDYNWQAIQNAEDLPNVATNITVDEALAFNKQCVIRTMGTEVLSSFDEAIVAEVTTQKAVNEIIMFLDQLGGPNSFKRTLDLELAEQITDALSMVQVLGKGYNEWQQNKYNLNLMLALTNHLIGFIDNEVNSLLSNLDNLDFSGFGRLLESSKQLKVENLRSYEGMLERVNQVALDNKCSKMDIGAVWSKQEPYFELHAFKVGIESPPETQLFVYQKNDSVNVRIPVAEILEESLLDDPQLEYLCFEVSFYQLNAHLHGQEDDKHTFIKGEQPLIKAQVYDSSGSHQSFTTSEAPVIFSFGYDFQGEGKDDYSDRTIECSSFSQSEWVDSCVSTLDFSLNEVRCRCSALNNDLISLVEVAKPYSEPQPRLSRLGSLPKNTQQISDHQSIQVSLFVLTWIVVSLTALICYRCRRRKTETFEKPCSPKSRLSIPQRLSQLAKSAKKPSPDVEQIPQENCDSRVDSESMNDATAQHMAYGSVQQILQDRSVSELASARPEKSKN